MPRAGSEGAAATEPRNNPLSYFGVILYAQLWYSRLGIFSAMREMMEYFRVSRKWGRPQTVFVSF